MNEIFSVYYDIIWQTNGLLLTDSTFLSINENSNQFSEITQLNPRRITDSLYHFTGIIPSSLSSANIFYNLKVRDKAMNTVERQDSVLYLYVNPDSSSSLLSPSGLARVFIDKSAVDEPIGIF